MMLTLRRMPFRPQMLLCRQAQITCPPSTKKTRRKREVFAEPYRTDLDIHPFSCDWENWEQADFMEVSSDWHDLSEMEFYVKRVGRIPGTIRPLAYFPAVFSACITFEAAGKYYFLNTIADYLERFGGGFRSHDDFLAAFIREPRIKGGIQQFSRDCNGTLCGCVRGAGQAGYEGWEAPLFLSSQSAASSSSAYGTKLRIGGQTENATARTNSGLFGDRRGLEREENNRKARHLPSETYSKGC
ncbi:hypothetical protein C8F01DRAFT_1082760 [Mycena amicta]|nr:hypothetical protein C8F01DRAFT_1082760 [Mycena amicta]